MKIRSITYFCNPKYPFDESILQQAGTFLSEAKSAYEAEGYEVDVAGSAEEAPRIIAAHVRDMSCREEASVWSFGFKCLAAHAAFANTASMHALDRGPAPLAQPTRGPCCPPRRACASRKRRALPHCLAAPIIEQSNVTREASPCQALHARAVTSP